MVVLKGLLEDGQLILQDGRKIVSPRHFAGEEMDTVSDENIILMHPDFRLFVLVSERVREFNVLCLMFNFMWYVFMIYVFEGLKIVEDKDGYNDNDNDSDSDSDNDSDSDITSSNIFGIAVDYYVIHYRLIDQATPFSATISFVKLVIVFQCILLTTLQLRANFSFSRNMPSMEM